MAYMAHGVKELYIWCDYNLDLQWVEWGLLYSNALHVA
jgi:hypothetical protein